MTFQKWVPTDGDANLLVGGLKVMSIIRSRHSVIGLALIIVAASFLIAMLLNTAKTNAIKTKNVESPGLSAVAMKNAPASPNLESEDMKRKNIARQLLNSYKKYINDIETDIKSGKFVRLKHLSDFVKASDKANGLLGVYSAYLTAEELQWVANKQQMIVDKIGNSSPVYFGYAKDGFHVIVLAQPTTTPELYYMGAMGEIRGDPDEGNFLIDFWQKLGKNYYVLDVYVEDLMEIRKEFKLGISISDDGGIKYPIGYPQDEKVNEIFRQYKRGSVDNHDTIKSGDWKLYFFEEVLGFPDIRITYDGEEILPTSSTFPPWVTENKSQ